MDDLMNKIQNVLNDEESMKQIKELADMLTADNGGQGEQGGKSEAPTQSPQNMDFSQLLQSLGAFLRLRKASLRKRHRQGVLILQSL